MAEHYSQALNRSVAAEDIAYDDWIRQYLRVSGLPDHVQQHIATMARLHHEDHYNRVSDDFQRVIGEPAQTVEQYIAAHPQLFGG